MNAIPDSNIFAATNAVAWPLGGGGTFRHPQASASAVALAFGDPAGVQASFQARYRGFGSGAPSAAVNPDWKALPSSRADPHAEVFDRLIDLKVSTATIAMHLQDAWRTGLFRQLDDLLDEENWHPGDTLPTPDSFRTFLRLVIMLGRPPRPGLGCTDSGNILASWRRTEDRLTIECRLDDELRWVLSRRLLGETESAAGICKVKNLRSRLAPYEPEVWFVAHDKHSRP